MLFHTQMFSCNFEVGVLRSHSDFKAHDTTLKCLMIENMHSESVIFSVSGLEKKSGGPYH